VPSIAPERDPDEPDRIALRVVREAPLHIFLWARRWHPPKHTVTCFSHKNV
jgi:hypothetical protein